MLAEIYGWFTEGFPFLLTVGLILQDAMLARQGRNVAGIDQMRQGLAAYRATGAEALRTYYLALLAEVYGAGGQPEQGLAVLTEALQAVDKTGECFYEAELWRLKGQLTLQSQTSPKQVKTSRKV